MCSSSLKEMFPNFAPLILGMRLDEVTEGLFRWRTIKNMRSKGLIPEDCFEKISPRKVLIRRDPFLEWAERYARSHK